LLNAKNIRASILKDSEGCMDISEISEVKELLYGANEHQKAGIAKIESGIEYEILSRNKDLGYIDYINLSENIRVLGEFFDVNAAVLTLEGSICAVALADNPENAFEKVIESNPIAVMGATLGFSKTVSLEAAKKCVSLRIKNIISCEFSKEAFSYLLDTDINMVLVKSPLHELQGFEEKDIKVTPFGILVQEQDKSKLTKENFKIVTQAKPSQEQLEDGIFAWKISKYLKSCCAVVAKDLCARAIVSGKSNMVEAVEDAVDFACENSKDGVLVLDSAIETKEVINAAIQGRIGLIIESGDGKKSSSLLKYADKYGIAMIFTKIRNKRY